MKTKHKGAALICTKCVAKALGASKVTDIKTGEVIYEKEQ